METQELTKKMSEDKKQKMIFAKATATNFCAITVYPKNGNLMVCDVVDASDIEQFMKDVEVMSRVHDPELVQFECTIYQDECKGLRDRLLNYNIKVRGYKSEGTYLNRIVSQAQWIERRVLVNEVFTSFIDRMTSFSLSDPDKTNIALDVLSDATKFQRRYSFK